jgi:hypothetical protein
MTCCVLNSSVVACIMSGESVPLATGEGCRVLFCVVLCCPFVSFPLESCLEAFFISSVGYMPYCPVVFRPVSRCFVTCCYETGLLAIYPAQPTKGCSLFRLAVSCSVWSCRVYSSSSVSYSVFLLMCKPENTNAFISSGTHINNVSNS